MNLHSNGHETSATDLQYSLVSTFRSPALFFAGAGISRDSGLPTFEEMYEHILKMTLGDEHQDLAHAVSLPKRIRPEVIFQSLLQILGRDVFDFYEWLAGGEPNTNHYLLARALESGHCVFTTNVDTLIEQACFELKVGYELCVADREFALVSKRRSRNGSSMNASGCLFKVRGTIDRAASGFDRFATVPVTMEGGLQSLSKYKQTVLEQCLQTREAVVLGYSASDHFSVQPILARTPSEKPITWLQHRDDGRTFCEKGSGFFQQQIREERDKLLATDGRERIADWELMSVNEVLAGRDSAAKWHGNVSEVLDAVAKELGLPTRRRKHLISPPKPKWAKSVRSWQRSLLLARLYRLVLDLEKAEEYGKRALRATQENAAQGEICSELGSIYLVPSKVKNDAMAAKMYGRAAARWNAAGRHEKALIAQLDEANVLRRMRRFNNALGVIEEVRAQVEDGALDAKQKSVIQSYQRSLAGLCRGLQGGASGAERRKAVRDCQAAFRHARRSKHIRRLNAALNSAGLVFLEAAGKDEEKLTQARAMLEEAFEVSLRIRDDRGCFQPARNIGLAHLRLAEGKQGKAQVQEYEQALDWFTQSGLFLAKCYPRPEGEVLEVQFRTGESLVRLGRDAEAQEVLLQVLLARRGNDDWHNEARTLDLLLATEASSGEAEDWLKRIVEIYEDVLADEGKVAALFEYPIRLTNAISIVGHALQVAKQRGVAMAIVQRLRACEDSLKQLSKRGS